ncbi:MAG: excinuclease ABC subunit UvrC, partial [Chrysiogenales bacterium]
SGLIIYIGKASSLKKRVSSYFQKRETDAKTRVLVKALRDIECIITDSEVEALILESTLIKKHRPKYNIRLKDDKRYPYIAVTLGDDYPRVTYTRTIRTDGTRYFGPFTDARAAKNTVALINSIFKLKTCTRVLPLTGNERPCLNRQINKCSGVCQGSFSSEEYLAIIESVVSFLEGRIAPVVANLGELMKHYSSARNYERAAEIRDMLFDIQKVSETQKVHVPIGMDQDYIGVATFGNEGILVLFEFRGGVLLGRKISVYENAQYATQDEIIGDFIPVYYQNADVPHRIITSIHIPDRALLEGFLSGKSGRKVSIVPPRTRDDRGLISLILKNIAVIAAERHASRENRDTARGLDELQSLLDLDAPPALIECFDISNLAGADAVASMVAFRDGRPHRAAYRRYRIRGYESPDDPGMIHEAVARRMQYLVNEGLELPDLIVVDGGRTQLARALEAARNFIGTVRVISLAKRFEEIYSDPMRPPLKLPDGAPALRILTAIRDEAHRFAVAYHRKLRSSRTRRSSLDDLPIGARSKVSLLAHFKSIDAIRNATVEELEGAPGIGVKTAKKVFDAFH